MPLRELTDRSGVVWKVWDITPDQLHPSSRAGDYLQGYLDGWLVFETTDGAEKRRLYPVPADWEEVSDEELERLCERAESVRGGSTPARRRDSMPGDAVPEPPGAPSGPTRDTARETPRPPERPDTRTFHYPGGRVWTVAEQYIQLRDRMGTPLGARTVLRFTSGVRSLDLHAWPSEWRSYSDEELAELLARAFPRDRDAPASGSFRRRRSDQRV
jgi:hypothetical protein